MTSRLLLNIKIFLMAEGIGLRQIREAFRIPSAVLILTDKKFVPQGPTLQQKEQNFDIDQTDPRDPSLGYQSPINTPVYTNIEFLPGQYETDVKGVFKSFGSSTDGPDRLRFESVLITVSQDKKIITTEIQGKNGTVKEYIGDGDYQVTVDGIISGKNGQRPIDQIRSLKKMLDAPIAIQVASTYLQTLDINYLVLQSYQMGEQMGGYSYQTFSLFFLSDVQQELKFMSN